MMKLQNRNSLQFYSQPKQPLITNNCSPRHNRESKDYSQVSFKGKLSIFKVSVFKELFSKIFPAGEPAPVRAVQSETIKVIKKIQKTTASKTLPFDADSRLEKLGVKPEIRQNIINAANGNKDHYQKLARMIREGFDPESVSEIFNKAKGADGKLKTSYYNAAFILKEKIDQKYIIPILENFRLSSSKFDYDAFREFQNLKSRAYKAHTGELKAFKNMDKPQIDEFFYTNIEGIKKTAQLLGRENFLKLYNYDFEYIDLLVEKTPSFLNTIAKHKKLEKLTREKMNPISHIIDSNSKLSDRKSSSPHADGEFQDRISTLMELFEYAELLKQGKSRHSAEITQMIDTLRKLSS